MDAHFKSVEKAASTNGGKVDPFAGLSSTGIAGTGPEKEDENTASSTEKQEQENAFKKDTSGNQIYLLIRSCVSLP